MGRGRLRHGQDAAVDFFCQCQQLADGVGRDGQVAMGGIDNITLAGIVSVILAPASCAFYAVNTGAVFNEQFITSAIALTFLSWLCSMVGYDKVVQTFAQFKVKEDESKKENN